MPADSCERVRGAIPGMSGLAKAVGEDDGRGGYVAEMFDRESDVVLRDQRFSTRCAIGAGEAYGLSGSRSIRCSMCTWVWLSIRHAVVCAKKPTRKQVLVTVYCCNATSNPLTRAACSRYHARMLQAAEKAERSRLSAADWEAGALDLIAEQGVPALAVEPLARRLRVTKGSYWHFATREALLNGRAQNWETHAEEAMDQIAAIDDPRERLSELFRRTGREARTHSIYWRCCARSTTRSYSR